MKTLAQIVNRTYEGVDLTIKFADEISKAPYNGDEWAWIKGRIQVGNWEGIWVGDWIPFSAGGYTYDAQIMGINTYYTLINTYSGSFKNHIDFTVKQLWAIPFTYNLVNYNNGTTVSDSPWLASNAYAYMNSLQQNVPNSTNANPTLTPVDYRTSGIYYHLPLKLKNVLVDKIAPIPTRYSATGVLTNDNSMKFLNLSKIWPLYEREIFGSNVCATPEMSVCLRQYPLFVSKFPYKTLVNGGRPDFWVLADSSVNDNTYVVMLGWSGCISPRQTVMTNRDSRFPFCFRVAA